MRDFPLKAFFIPLIFYHFLQMVIQAFKRVVQVFSCSHALSQLLPDTANVSDCAYLTLGK